ncbi:MAG: DNA repair protein RadC [Armatimonadota bacterium]|nr:DNA repair protein RadC [Armatimonadota bacterium]
MSSPLDKLKEQGAAGLGPIELLAVAFARDDDDSELRLVASREMFEQVGGIRNLSRFSNSTFGRYGIDPLDAMRFQAAFELGRRSKEAKLSKEADLCNPEEVHIMFRFLADEPREQVWVALLDVKNQLILRTRLHIGTLDASVVGSRDVFGEALRVNAASIVLIHNHPSGDPSPSPEDVELTKRLKAAGKHLDIEVIDHVVIGGDGFASLHRLGLMG